jgi:hypothetical protein
MTELALSLFFEGFGIFLIGYIYNVEFDPGSG